MSGRITRLFSSLERSVTMWEQRACQLGTGHPTLRALLNYYVCGQTAFLISKRLTGKTTVPFLGSFADKVRDKLLPQAAIRTGTQKVNGVNGSENRPRIPSPAGW